MYLHKKFDCSRQRAVEDNIADRSSPSPVVSVAVPLPLPLPLPERPMVLHEQHRHQKSSSVQLHKFQPMMRYRTMAINLCTSLLHIELFSKQVDPTRSFSMTSERRYCCTGSNSVLIIEFTQPEKQRSIVLLFHTASLPRPLDKSFVPTQLLLRKIFHSTKPIFIWNRNKLDLDIFVTKGYLSAADIEGSTLVTLSYPFQQWYNKSFPHAHYCPVLSEYEADDPSCTCLFRPYKNITDTWTLENAVQYTFNELLSKTKATSTASCRYEFSYSIHYCLAMTKLFYALYSQHSM